MLHLHRLHLHSILHPRPRERHAPRREAHRQRGVRVSSAAGYCAELSPLALRGITTGSVNLWIVRKSILGRI